MLLFAGSSHPSLAQQIADHLGITLGKLELGCFPDREVSLQILESVRGQEVFVLQTIALDPNNYLVELLVMIDALKRASAGAITAVIPYFGYARQDRKDKPRQPITAKLVADLLTRAGASHILTMDLHAGQIEGFFDIPVDHIHGMPLLAQTVKEMICSNHPIVVVAPDIGSVKQARSYANFLGADLAVVDKRRLTESEVEIFNVVGDVDGKDVLLADDMCSTAGTLVSAAKACQEKGARRIFAVVTHGLFVDDAIERIEKSPIEALMMSNTIAETDRLKRSAKIKVVSVAPLLGHAIRCITSQESIVSMSNRPGK